LSHASTPVSCSIVNNIYKSTKVTETMVSGEKSCFVIAPIGGEESETRKRSDLVLECIIKPAAEKCGYKAVRADEISESGIITTQII